MDQDIENSIRERAYEIWEEEGRPAGREAQHWQQAAAEIADAQRERREAIAKGGAKGDAKAAGTTRKKAAGSAATDGEPGKTSGKTTGKTSTGIRKPRAKKTPSS